METATSMMNRFFKATERLGTPDVKNFDQDRIFRLREDIDAFRRDLKYLDAGGTIILAPDSAEIDSYIRPDTLLGYYCFPLEDRAKFDISIAISENREKDFDPDNATHKISRRILRARAHLFNLSRHNILLPPSLQEFNVYLSMILATRGSNDLDEVFKLINGNISKLRADDPILQKLDSLKTLDESEQLALLGSIFDRVVANPVMYADDLSLDSKNQRISKIVRANDFLLNSKSKGIEDFVWAKIIGTGQPELLSELQGVAPKKALVQYLENLFFRLPPGATNFSIYADAQALAYVATINDVLRKAVNRKVKVQFVSWALSPVRVARAYWPETGAHQDDEPLAEVRHPKLLAAALNFSNVSRTQVEADLDRFSQALSLYGEKKESALSSNDQLEKVRDAWSQLDNAFLAWTTRIQGSDAADELPLAKKRLEEIRQVIWENREAFQGYLVQRIDELSKTLSDEHWAVAQPANVSDLKADCLFYQPGNCIVIRPRTDYARFAIALYDADLITRINADLESKKSFGGTLIELTGAAHKSDASDDLYRERAEIQLLKAFLFAVGGNYVFTARYCQLARAELAQSESGSNTQAEILYLAHYAHRELGKEKRSEDEFIRCLRRLDESQQFWDKSSHKEVESLGLRYPISWMTTCREIAAAGIMKFKLSVRWKERARDAYGKCLRTLSFDLSKSSKLTFRLNRYQIARAAQNVMFAFAFDIYDVAGWRSSFSDVIKPTREDACSAWNAMRRIREPSLAEETVTNMARNDFAFAVGTYLFEDSEEERNRALDELRGLEAALEQDKPMQLAASHIIRRLRRQSR